MKRTLLIAATWFTLMSHGVGVYADDAPAAGTYYIENVGANRFFEGGNKYGTQASITERGIEISLESNGDGTYLIKTNMGSGYLGSNGYVDSSLANWILTPAEDGAYILSTSVEAGTTQVDKYLVWSGEGTALSIVDEKPTTANGFFRFVTKDERVAALAQATAEAPMNATFLIGNANFSRGESNAPWTMDAGNKNLSGGDQTNHCAESYHSVFSLTQTITVPAGVYALTAQGFYRQDGKDNDNLPYFFIGEEKGTFPLKSGSENSMTDASRSFTNGLYAIAPIYVQVQESGSIVVGAKNDVNTSLWCIWDNFQLTYYGADADVLKLKLGSLVTQVEDLRATATGHLSADLDLNEGTKKSLTDALTASENIEETEEAYNSVIEALKAAIAAVKPCVENKAAIDARYALLESTNVYTPEAYKTFKDAADDYLAKWNANELTETVVNPNNHLGWHGANDYDDFLLSAFGTRDFDTNLYINTWSKEGDDDGSEFKTPFFEYWTGNENSLGVMTHTATVKGLDADKVYAVSAWVRVRIKDGATGPTGITLSVGADGTPVDVTAGEQVPETPMYLGNFIANGKADAEGNLTINFNIEEGNNINWLAFKNLKYEEVTVMTSIDNVKEMTGFEADETVTLTAVDKTVTDVEINIFDKTDEECLTSMANMAKGEDGTFSYSFFHAIPFYKGHDYDVTFELYARETLEEGAEGPAPSKLVGTHTVTVKGLTEPFSFSSVKLTAVTPSDETEISAEEDLTVVLTFDSKVTPDAAKTFINEGQGFTTPFASQSSNEEGTEWSFVVPKDNFASKGQLTLAFGFVDENGKVVEGNEGGEAQSYFMYVYSVASAGNVATDLVPTVVIPENETTVSELTTIELQFDRDVMLPYPSEIPEGAVTLMQMRGNAVPVTIDYKDWTVSYRTVLVTLETPLKAGENDGLYVLTIQEGLMWDEAHENNEKTGSVNPVLTYKFEVGAEKVPANDFVPVSVTPAAESVVASLKTFEVKTSERVGLNFDLAETVKLRNTITNAEYAAVAAYPDDFEIDDVVVITLNEEVTEAGTYELVIPEALFGDNDFDPNLTPMAGHYNPELKYTYTIDPTVGVAGILADDAKVDVYSVSGVLVLKNADRAALKHLKKGIYVINGKKVVVK